MIVSQYDNMYWYLWNFSFWARERAKQRRINCIEILQEYSLSSTKAKLEKEQLACDGNLFITQ